MLTATTRTTGTAARRPTTRSGLRSVGGASSQHAGARTQVPASVEALLRRSDEELVAAQLSPEPAARFVHAHLAALRAGAAVLELAPRPARRTRPRPVWELVADAAPELAAQAAWFAGGAALRAAVEAGRADDVPEERADTAVAAAEEFQDAVRGVVATWSGADRVARAS
ncbi:SAV_6107 family HEPN domain-containing protein [Actinotalea sp. AC32]|nr:SAV_6107 family HEPN domain-containing protein [Actinotalea sp. AC32]